MGDISPSPPLAAKFPPVRLYRRQPKFVGETTDVAILLRVRLIRRLQSQTPSVELGLSNVRD